MPDDPPDDDGFTASDFDPPPHLMSPEDPTEYDAWFRASVERALANPGAGIPHEIVMQRLRAIIERKQKNS
jgi:DNA-damage-inducible protein J